MNIKFVPMKVAIPILVTSGIIILLSLILCCYLKSLQRKIRVEQGYKISAYRPKKSNSCEACAICLDDFQIAEKIVIARCQHSFHNKCLERWLDVKNACPICLSAIKKLKTSDGASITPNCSVVLLTSTTNALLIPEMLAWNCTSNGNSTSVVRNSVSPICVGNGTNLAINNNINGPQNSSTILGDNHSNTNYPLNIDSTINANAHEEQNNVPNMVENITNLPQTSSLVNNNNNCQSNFMFDQNSNYTSFSQNALNSPNQNFYPSTDIPNPNSKIRPLSCIENVPYSTFDKKQNSCSLKTSKNIASSLSPITISISPTTTQSQTPNKTKGIFSLSAHNTSSSHLWRAQHQQQNSNSKSTSIIVSTDTASTNVNTTNHRPPSTNRSAFANFAARWRIYPSLHVVANSTNTKHTTNRDSSLNSNNNNNFDLISDDWTNPIFSDILFAPNLGPKQQTCIQQVRYPDTNDIALVYSLANYNNVTTITNNNNALPKTSCCPGKDSKGHIINFSNNHTRSQPTKTIGKTGEKNHFMHNSNQKHFNWFGIESSMNTPLEHHYTNK